MPQGKLRGGLRGEVQSTVRESYGGKAVTSNFKSRVVHPRNPKLVKGSPEDDKVNFQLNVELCHCFHGSWHKCNARHKSFWRVPFDLYHFHCVQYTLRAVAG